MTKFTPSFSTQRSVQLLLQVVSEESPSVGKKEQSQPEKKDWQEKAPSGQPKEKEREARDKDREKEKERERDKEKAAQNQSHGDDFERTPSGRVRRRSAQVAVFHLQEIAEDELAKDWGTKRRIKDDLVPDSKRVRTESGCIKRTRSTFQADMNIEDINTCGLTSQTGTGTGIRQHCVTFNAYSHTGSLTGLQFKC